MRERFTVAICTRNRRHFLEKCLDALAQSIAELDVPILVVDNGSTDETASYLSSCPYPMRVLQEERAGLSAARNCALAHCDTEYLVFLDDDGIPSSTWAPAIKSMIERLAPDVFGGPYTPFYTTPRPDWFEDSHGSAHLDLMDGPQPRGVCFSGGNMGWRTSLLHQFGGFDENLGMTDSKLRLGEETSIQCAIWSKMPDAIFAFAKDMHMTHHVSRQKMSLAYISKRNFIYGWQLSDIDRSNELLSINKISLIYKTKLGLPLLLRIFIRDRNRFPYWKSFAANYLVLASILSGIWTRKVLKSKV